MGDNKLQLTAADKARYGDVRALMHHEVERNKCTGGN